MFTSSFCTLCICITCITSKDLALLVLTYYTSEINVHILLIKLRCCVTLLAIVDLDSAS